MPKVSTKLPRKPREQYKIYIQKQCTKEIPKYLKKMKIGKKYAIITDSIVKKLFGKYLLSELKKSGIEAELIEFPKGELSKRLSTVEILAEKLLKKGFDRHDAIIALGGGVVGDLAGFLASIYMRGIPYIQVPTTILAMVDSAIGGKTGVDLKGGKNLLGTVAQPAGVFIDLDFLKGLPDKQVKSGLAEVIKYGVIKDKKLFTFLEENMEKVLEKDEKALEFIVKRSIAVKTKIVEKDERENKGLRIVFNYGHTYGHAIEKKSGYKLLHGYAISIGMIIANQMAVKEGKLKKEDAKRISKLIKLAGLPTVTINKPTLQDLLADKKKSGDCVQMVFPSKIGKTYTKLIECK